MTNRTTRPGATISPQIEEDAARLAGSLNALAADLFGRLRCESGNLFYSPASIAVALAMAAAGARGATEGELRAVLRTDLPHERLHAALGHLLFDIQARALTTQNQLHTANAVWTQRGAPLRQDFVGLLERNHRARVQDADFAGNPEEVRAEIHRWVAEKTGGMIEQLVDRIAPETAMMLVNAIYFAGRWSNPFHAEETRDAMFHLSDGTTCEVPTMMQTRHILHASLSGLDVVQLNYQQEDLVMDLIVPGPGTDLHALERELADGALPRWLGERQLREVQLYLPRFRVDSRPLVTEALRALGLERTMAPGADFTGVHDDARLFVSEVAHRAIIEVDENGTKAAAATAIPVCLLAFNPSRPLVVRADRPFLFTIRDRVAEVVLFLGRVADPR